MPIFAGLLASLFGSTVSLFALFLTKKAALATAAVVTFSAMTVAMAAAMAALISTVLGTTGIHAAILQGMAMFMPSNLPLCVSAVIAAHATAAVYRWNQFQLLVTATI